MAKVYVEDIMVESLFEWFSGAISSSGGDGAAVICCANPKETADLFVRWFKESTGRTEFWHPRDEYVKDGVTYVNFHDPNENYIFCDADIDMGHGDYSFIVKKGCRFGWYNHTFGNATIGALGGTT